MNAPPPVMQFSIAAPLEKSVRRSAIFFSPSSRSFKIAIVPLFVSLDGGRTVSPKIGRAPRFWLARARARRQCNTHGYGQNDTDPDHHDEGINMPVAFVDPTRIFDSVQLRIQDR
jgi:hypothetical protein